MANAEPDPASSASSPGAQPTPESALKDAARQVADISAIASEASRGEGTPFTLPAFGTEGTPQDARALDLLGDVNLNVKIELGRTRMLIEDVLRLASGSVVELDKLAGDPVDIFVNDRFVAKGEVLVLNDNFCVRINEIVKPIVEGEARAQKAG
jgi:flagellar motor switch protein FliN/FliY